MTKRWLSFLMVLTMLVSVFAGASAAELAPKALTDTITFIPRAEEIKVIKGDPESSLLLGTFQVDNGAFDTDAALFVNGLDANAFYVEISTTTEPDPVPVKVSKTIVNGSLYVALGTNEPVDGSVITVKMTAGSATATTGYYAAIEDKTMKFKVSDPAKSLEGLYAVDNLATKLVNGKEVLVSNDAFNLAVEGLKTSGAALTADDVKWTTSNSDVISINAKGTDGSGETVGYVLAADLKLNKPGEATITATATDKDGKSIAQSVKLVVTPVLPTTVYIKNATANVNETTQLEVSFVESQPTDKTGKWMIVEEKGVNGQVTTVGSVATIDGATGLLTGVGPGKAVVRFTATAKDSAGKAVVSPDKEIEVLSMLPTTVKAVEFSVKDADGKPVAPFTNLKTEVEVTLTSSTVGATIYYTTDGKTTPSKNSPSKKYEGPFKISEGQTIQAIAYKEGLTDASVTSKVFTFKLAITSLTASPETLNIAGSEKKDITLTLGGKDKADNTQGEGNLNITVTGGNVDVATIDATKAATEGIYTLTGVGKGEMTLVFTNAYSGKSANVKVVVTQPAVTGLTLDQTSLEMKVGEAVQLNASVQPESAFADDKKVVWTSSNSAVAEVDNTTAKGKVTAKTEGTAIIGVSTVDGKFKKQCTVTVTAAGSVPADPEFSIDSKTFTEIADDCNKVSITTRTVDAKVYYTMSINGAMPADPTEHSIEVERPIEIDPDNEIVIIKAIAISGDTKSNVVTKTYMNNIAPTKVVIDTTKIKGDVGEKDIDTVKKTITATGAKKFTGVLEATFTPTQTTDDSVVWTSSNPAVATIDATGKIETLTAGKTTIKVASKAVSTISDSYELIVEEVKPSKVTVTPVTKSIPAGQTASFAALVQGEDDMSTDTTVTNTAVTWAVSDTTLASVDANGVVTALKYDADKTTVSVTATTVAKNEHGLSVSGVATVTIAPTASKVADPVIKATVNGKEVSGNSIAAPATVTMSSATVGAAIYYTTDGTTPTKEKGKPYSAPFEISENVTIRARAFKDDLDDSELATVTYGFELKASDLKLSVETLELEVGETQTITGTITPAGAKDTITWNLSNAIVTKVDDAAKNTTTVTAASVGTVTVTATVNGIEKTCKITVKPVAVKSVSITPAQIDISAGKTFNVVALVAPTNAATEIEYKSDNEAVVKYDSGNTWTALKAGKATITATAKADPTKKATCVVTVTEPTSIPDMPTKIPTFVADKKELSVLENTSLSVVVGTITPGEGDTIAQLDYYYNLSAASAAINEKTPVFTVDSKGVVTMTIANVGASAGADPIPFTVTWTADPIDTRNPRDDQDNPILVKEARDVDGYKLTITKEPTKDEKAVADAKDAIGKLPAFDMSKVTDEATAKAELLKAANDAIKGTGIVLTEADITISDFKAATETEDGSFKYSIELVSGAANGTAAGTATIAHVKPVAKIDVDAKSGRYDNGKATPKKNRLIVGKADGTVTFKVPGYTNATNWKSSKKKIITIDPTTGVATLKKNGSNVVISATVDGKKISQRVNVVSAIATKTAGQFRLKGKKWKAADPAVASELRVGKQGQVRAVSVEPTSKAKRYGVTYKAADESIVSVSKSGVVKGLMVGTTDIVIKTFNDVETTVKVSVVDVYTNSADEEEVVIDAEEIEIIEEELEEEAE